MTPFPHDTPPDAARILESITDAFFALDADWRFTYLNAQAERLLGRTRAELLGRNVWEEFPAAVGTAFDRQYRRALDEQETVTFEEFYPPPLDTWFQVKAYPSPDGLSVFFQDVTERRRAVDAVRASEEALRENEIRLKDAQTRLETALSAGGIATWTWDVASDRVVADTNLAPLFSVSPEDAAGGKIGVYLQAIHPEDRARVAETIQEALADRTVYEAQYRVVLPDGTHRWLATRGRVERDAAGRAISLPGVVLDITQRVEREQRERFLADLAERARRLTDPDEVIAEAVRSVGVFLGVSRCLFADIDIEADTCAVPPHYRADDSVASIAGVFPISAFGPFVVAEYEAGRTAVVDDVRADPTKAPPESLAAYEAIGIRAYVAAPVLHSARLVSAIAVHSNVPRHWKAEEVELLQTVVERTWLTVEVTRQQRALARGAEVTSRILESITDAFFTLDRDWRVTRVNDQAERLMTKKRDQILGQNFWEVFPRLIGSTFEREYRRAMGEGVAVSFQEFYQPLDAWLEVRAYPSTDGLSVFYQNVTARKRAEAERERLLAEQQKRAEREAILNRIGQAIRSASDPEAVQEEAVNLLGDVLGADRCYFALYDLARGVVTIARDKHRTDLPSIQGVYPFQNTAEMFRELYGDSNTSVVQDAHTASLSAQTKSNMELLRLRSRVSVALVEGEGLMATLTAAMAEGPRDWTQDDVALVEAVGTQLRTAVEMARVTQREHNIAEQLQSALQPPLPERISGLSVGKFTRPALDEARVGGDFYDVFPLDKELWAIVIGDVSGKGLAAAQQLALIRNSLRTTLYLYRTPAQAAAALNKIVTAHDLLVGFVTAWVGIYDAATGQITFCSCGHEPALIRRAGGPVEEMETTAPPLGVWENADYRESSVTMCSGDTLLLYTDGISEAGPSRRELLGTEGLMRLFGELPIGMEAQAEADTLVAEVSAYTNGVFRDDVAVLLLRHH